MGDMPEFPTLRPVDLAPLMTISAEIGAMVEVSGTRRYIPITGGAFTTRDGLRGVVLPGGADWQVVRPDGALEIEAHYALRTDAGDGIEVHSSGLRNITPKLAARVAAGDDVDPGLYYFRTAIRMTTAAPALGHLDKMLAIATARRDRSAVLLDVHEVL